MQVFEKVKKVLMEILDFDGEEITLETYLVRELDAESIDLLEIALEMGSEFGVEVKDDDLFLRNLREYILEAGEKGVDVVSFITEKLPHISKERAAHMLEDLSRGPVLKVKDLVSYMEGGR